MRFETAKRKDRPRADAPAISFLFTAAVLWTAAAVLWTACAAGPKARKVNGVYHPDATQFFSNTDDFEGKDVYLDGLWVVEIKEGTPLVLKRGGIESLLYVTDYRNLARPLKLAPGDPVAIYFFCGGGSLSGGNLLNSITRQ